MIVGHKPALRIKHHISVVLVMTIRGTLRITGITQILVPDICHNVDEIVLGQTAESFLHRGTAKPNSIDIALNLHCVSDFWTSKLILYLPVIITHNDSRLRINSKNIIVKSLYLWKVHFWVICFQNTLLNNA